MELTLDSLCTRLKGQLIGDGGTLIRGLDGLVTVQEHQLTYADSPQSLLRAMLTPAAAILVPSEVTELDGRNGIRVPNPKLAFALLLELYYPETKSARGVHPSAVLGKNVQLAEEVSIGPHVVIGDGAAIGRSTVIGSGVYIGEQVKLGEDCIVDPNVVFYRGTLVGDRVRIHAGTVIGGDGFGYVFHEGCYVKVPQVGNVIIEDDVEIGCNVCVDRSTTGSTVVGKGTKIDNLVQIAHNNRIGKHVVLAGQVGLAGSVTVGDYTIMGGQAGVSDHIVIGKGVKLGIGALVIKSLQDKETVWGSPARPAQEAKRQIVSLGRLPGLLHVVRHLMNRLQQNETRLSRLEDKIGKE